VEPIKHQVLACGPDRVGADRRQAGPRTAGRTSICSQYRTASLHRWHPQPSRTNRRRRSTLSASVARFADKRHDGAEGILDEAEGLFALQGGTGVEIKPRLEAAAVRRGCCRRSFRRGAFSVRPISRRLGAARRSFPRLAARRRFLDAEWRPVVTYPRSHRASRTTATAASSGRTIGSRRSYLPCVNASRRKLSVQVDLAHSPNGVGDGNSPVPGRAASNEIYNNSIGGLVIPYFQSGSARGRNL
jgi:hypothetical protein